MARFKKKPSDRTDISTTRLLDHPPQLCFTEILGGKMFVQRGDLVRSALGGPLMVAWEDGQSGIRCVAFRRDELKAEEFTASDLIVQQSVRDRPAAILREGSRAKLASGGPILTIHRINADGIAECINGSHKYEIHLSMLMGAGHPE